MKELLASTTLSVRSFSKGEKVRGKVLEKTGKSLILDIGGKSEGLVAEKAYAEAKAFIRDIEIGDEISAKVLIPETTDGYTILSLRNTVADYYWEKLEQAEKKGTAVRVEVKAVNPSGLTVETYGLIGFVPASHIGKELAKDTSKLVGKRLPVEILELNRDTNRIVFSEKAVSEKEEYEASKKALDDIKEGEVYQGKVTSVTDFGCFVSIDVPKKGKNAQAMVEGLVHISELSWKKVEKSADAVTVGDILEVQVIGTRDGKLSLSVKQAQTDPWQEAEKKYSKDQRVKGRVVKQSDFGVFVELEPGVEGLIHMTKVPPGKKLVTGQEVEVYIEDIDGKARKISLGLVLTEKPLGYK